MKLKYLRVSTGSTLYGLYKVGLQAYGVKNTLTLNISPISNNLKVISGNRRLVNIYVIQKRYFF